MRVTVSLVESSRIRACSSRYSIKNCTGVVCMVLWKQRSAALTLTPAAEGEQGPTLGQLLRRRLFWVFLVMMLCAGASEQAVSQWASTFAEQALGVSKTVGDLAGPMAFALLMGTARLLYGKYGDRLDLDRFMKFSCLLCIAAYLCIALVPVPALGLVGCAVCGFSVGIMWPGTFSKASASLKGGTAMFALLALAGDLGCSAGPTLAGMVSSSLQDDLRAGILAAICFPVLLLVGVLALKRRRQVPAPAK